MYAHGLSVHQKYPNHTLTNLLFGLFRIVLIIDPLVTYLGPHPETSTCPFTPKVLRTKEHTPIPSSIVFIFRFAFKSFKDCEGVSIYVIERLEDASIKNIFSFTT
jgi:hypothetical protein